MAAAAGATHDDQNRRRPASFLTGIDPESPVQARRKLEGHVLRQALEDPGHQHGDEEHKAWKRKGVFFRDVRSADHSPSRAPHSPNKPIPTPVPQTAREACISNPDKKRKTAKRGVTKQEGMHAQRRHPGFLSVTGARLLTPTSCARTYGPSTSDG